MSIQVAARELRYKWFEEIRKDFNYKYIATAHHRDDSVETFFINLIRGTGIAGLHGILPKQGNIIRPMLFTGKEEIIKFAKKNKLKHREDSSNASDKYLRNKIRQTLMPVLKELNPSIEDTLTATIHRLRDIEKVFGLDVENKKKKCIKKGKNGLLISIQELKKLDPINTYLFEFLKPFNFNETSVHAIAGALDAESGKQFLSDTHRLIKDRLNLIVESRHSDTEKKKSEYSIAKMQIQLIAEDLRLEMKMVSAKNFKLKFDKNVVCLNFDKLAFPLKLRRWKLGDTFQPLGMKGKKKLSDFFTDNKFSISEKENVWLLTSANKIVWIVGHRMDERYKVNGKTKQIYFVNML